MSQVSTAVFMRFGPAIRGLFRRRSWKVAGLWLRGARVLLVDLAGIVGVIALALFVWRESTREILQIDSIGVPPSLANEGYTGDIIAQRLMDHIFEVQHNATLSSGELRIALAETEVTRKQSDIVVPGTGFSVQAIAAYVSELIGTRRTRVGGEITERNGRLSLRLRLEGWGAIGAPKDVSREDLEAVLTAGSEEIVSEVQPYMLLSYFYNGERWPDALRQLDRITADGIDGNEERARASYMRGIFQFRIQQSSTTPNYDEAIASYREAISLDPEFAGAYNNLGSALLDSGKIEEAIANYREAIRRDPTFSDGYADLGIALRDHGGDPREAISLLREAIKLKPTDAQYRMHLGLALENVKQTDEAMSAYRDAIALAPELAGPYFHLAAALEGEGNHEEAIDNFKKSIGRNSGFPPAYLGLGTSLARLGRERQAAGDLQGAEDLLRDACEALAYGWQLAPNDQGFANAVTNVNALLPVARRCLPSQ